MTKDQIKERLMKHYHKAVEHFGEDRVFGVFLYGSQNYNLDTETSDVDTKCILLPSYMEMCTNKQWTSVELHIDDEHCECKDIREMVLMWQKMNMNFIEILFTDYFYINPKYSANTQVMSNWNNILTCRQKIAYYDVHKAFQSIIGQTRGTVRSTDLTAKKVMTAARLEGVLMKYIEKKNYGDIIQCSYNERLELMKLKETAEEISQDSKRDIVIRILNTMESLARIWRMDYPDYTPNTIYNDVWRFVRDMLIKSQFDFL